jgi:hypothetical protein
MYICKIHPSQNINFPPRVTAHPQLSKLSREPKMWFEIETRAVHLEDHKSCGERPSRNLAVAEDFDNCISWKWNNANSSSLHRNRPAREYELNYQKCSIGLITPGECEHGGVRPHANRMTR